MGLTSHERQRLAEIEDELTSRSPGFAEMFVPGRLSEQLRLREHWRRIGLTLALVAMGVNVVGATLKSVELTVISGVLCVSALVLAWIGPSLSKRPPENDRPPDDAGEPMPDRS